MILMLLLISGNIHPNPGPRSIRHKCPLCRKSACVEERIICSSACDSWYHVACLNISFPLGEPNGRGHRIYPLAMSFLKLDHSF